MSQILDVVTLPLDRPRQLVEASAGTGKTFTLAQLVLRFVVEENVPVESLLVVTFTEAATLELRERIRHRMRQALDAEKHDPVLKRLWDRWGDTPGAELATQRLRTALASLELATISTIHGWCQRVIQECGSELGMVEGAEVVTDVQPLLEQVWHDLARRCTLEEPRTVAAKIAGLKNPHKWMSLASRGPTLLPALAPSVPTAEVIAGLEHAVVHSHEILSEMCAEHAEGMLATISHYVGEERLPKGSFKVERWDIDSLGERRSELHLAIDGGDEENWIPHLASAESWQKVLKKAYKGTPHPCMLFGDAYLAWCEAKTTLKAATDARALQRWHDLLARVPVAYRQAKGPQRMDFDDLLVSVEQAVKRAHGTEVLSSLRRRWQIALVDEFQDTDAVQWGIFSQVFPADAHDARMILVGDPKQSIYAFRGAELDVYFGARGAVPPHCRWNLGTNFRSDGRVLEAIEHWFTEDGRQPFLDERMQWQAVRAYHPSSRLMVDGVPVAPMRFVRPESPDEESGLENHEILVRDIVWSLDDQSETWVVTSEGRRRLTAADIAVLVPSHTKAAKVQAALIHAGVPAIRRTRASVWESEAAGDLRVLLCAVLEPGRRRHVAGLLHSRLMPLDAAGVAHTLEDEARYAEVLQKLQGLREVLERRGVLGLIHEAMSEIVVTSLGHEDGARWVTDFRHVGELLHGMARRKGSSTLALPSVLAELGREDLEAEAPRLERDGDAVRVMTYHASKGLEFGVVYLPELRSAGSNTAPFSWSKAGTRMLVVPDIKFKDAGADDYADVRAQEQERLLYVAMTRAVYGIVVPHPLHLGRNSGPSMAVMRLGKFTVKTGEWPGLQTFLDTSKGLAVLDTAPRPLTRLTPKRHIDGLRAPVRAERVPSPPSRRTSFSRITSSHAGEDLPDHDAAMPRLEPMNLEDAAPPTDSFMSFPRGAKPGTAVHEVFEEIDFQELQGPEADGVITKALKNYGFDEDRWHEPVRQMLTDTCATPLGPHGVQLSSLTRIKRLDEFSFAMPVENVEAALYALGDALACDARFADYAKAVRVLPPQQVEGLLTGFIDLVFEADGRFYVVDYKTNFLGNHPEAYVAHRLDQAMAEHHYTLQGLIYSVAMSRFFEQRVPDWSEDRWGGILYLFVRGMRGRNAEDGVWFWRPSLEQLTIAAQGFGGGE